MLSSSSWHPLTGHVGANGSKLDQGSQRMDIRMHFSTQMVLKHRNRLPREAINAPSLSVYTRHLDNILNN